MTTIINSNKELPEDVAHKYLQTHCAIMTEEQADKTAKGNRSWWWKEQKLLYVEVKDEH